MLTYSPDPEEETPVAEVVLRRFVLLGLAQGCQLLADRAAIGESIAREVLGKK